MQKLIVYLEHKINVRDVLRKLHTHIGARGWRERRLA